MLKIHYILEQNVTLNNIILKGAIPEPPRWKYLFHNFSQEQCRCSSSMNTYLTFTCIWHCDLAQEDNENNIAPHLRSLASWSRYRKQNPGALGSHSKWQMLAVKGWPWCLWRLQIRCSLLGFDAMPTLVAGYQHFPQSFPRKLQSYPPVLQLPPAQPVQGLPKHRMCHKY